MTLFHPFGKHWRGGFIILAVILIIWSVYYGIPKVWKVIGG